MSINTLNNTDLNNIANATETTPKESHRQTAANDSTVRVTSGATFAAPISKDEAVRLALLRTG